MEENVRLELFTVRQVRDWLERGTTARGLSEEIIPRTRAWAIVHNPYEYDDDLVAVAIFVGDIIAAHVSTYPEVINKERYWTFPGLWCAPQFRGRGYSMIVMGVIAEQYGADHCIDKWAAPEAVEIFKYFGLNTMYVPRYILGVDIKRDTIKGKLAYFVRSTQRVLHRLFESPQKQESYALCYLPYIDDTTYRFISAHNEGDYFHHEREFLNWVIHYPLTISAPLMGRVKGISPFSPSEMPNSQYYAVQVLDDDVITGFYILKRKEISLHILYLYYEDSFKTHVFASIRDHVKRFGAEQCVTENQELANYLNKQIYFPKCSKAEISLSYPSSMSLPSSGKSQYGDCDNFMV